MNIKRKEIKKDFSIAGEQPVAEAPAAPAQIEIPVSFDTWWIRTQHKHKLKPALKEAVKAHFDARGFTDYKKFDAGLRDFGFNT